MHITICKRDDQGKFDVWSRELKVGALRQPRGMGWGGRWWWWGSGFGGTCAPMGDSCWYMEKTTTILWRNYPPIKRNKLLFFLKKAIQLHSKLQQLLVSFEWVTCYSYFYLDIDLKKPLFFHFNYHSKLTLNIYVSRFDLSPEFQFYNFNCLINFFPKYLICRKSWYIQLTTSLTEIILFSDLFLFLYCLS